MLLITDNTKVESRTRYLVKYVINNIMSTALTGQRQEGYVFASRAGVTV